MGILPLRVCRKMQGEVEPQGAGWRRGRSQEQQLEDTTNGVLRTGRHLQGALTFLVFIHYLIDSLTPFLGSLLCKTWSPLLLEYNY